MIRRQKVPLIKYNQVAHQEVFYWGEDKNQSMIESFKNFGLESRIDYDEPFDYSKVR